MSNLEQIKKMNEYIRQGDAKLKIFSMIFNFSFNKEANENALIQYEFALKIAIFIKDYRKAEEIINKMIACKKILNEDHDELTLEEQLAGIYENNDQLDDAI